jgi:hypothetical protein
MELVNLERPDGAWPLSKTQEWFWWYTRHTRLLPARFNHLPVVLTMRGPFDPSSFRAALDDLTQRHAALRTVFSEAARPRQHLLPPQPIDVPVIDLRHLSGECQLLQRDRLFREAATRPFDLCAAPAWRCLLVRLADDRHDWLFVCHHILVDAWSFRVLVADWVELYQAHRLGEAANLLPPTATHLDYAAYEEQQLESGALENQIRYWLDHLADAPDSLDLPTDRPADLTSGCSGRLERFVLPVPLSQSVQATAAERGVTPFSVVLAAFYALLHQLTGQDDLTVVVPAANRTRRQWRHVVGCLAQGLRP